MFLKQIPNSQGSNMIIDCRTQQETIRCSCPFEDMAWMEKTMNFKNL